MFKLFLVAAICCVLAGFENENQRTRIVKRDNAKNSESEQLPRRESSPLAVKGDPESQVGADSERHCCCC